jgi:hypothetical protein
VVRGKFIEIRNIIKIEVEHCPVMLGGSDQNSRFSPEQKVMRIFGMEAEWRKIACAR